MTQPIEWTPHLGELELGHAQVWGTVRLVPVIRRRPIDGLRLHRHAIGDVVAASPGSSDGGARAYLSFVPHGYVLRWDSEDPERCAEGAALGALMTQKRRLDPADFAPLHVRSGRVQRMVKRTPRGLAFLPLHLAMEGFLSFQFGGPSRIFTEYCDDVIRRGLSPRVECSMRGRDVPALDDALRVFEVHPQQVGVLLFIGDEFTSAVVVPNEDDYLALHRDLLSDFFADTLIHHALGYPEVPDWRIDLADVQADTLSDISELLKRTKREWAEFHRDLSSGFFGRPHRATERYRMGSYSLRTLLPSFDPSEENHMGECIVGEDGELAYLKTYRLSAAQARRGYLLQQLAGCGWDLEKCASLLGSTKAEFIARLENAGFGYLLKPHVLEEAARQRRR